MRPLSALAALIAPLLLALAPERAIADVAPAYSVPVVVAQIPTHGESVSFFAIADFNADGHEDALFTRSTYLGTETFPVVVLVGDGQGGFSDATGAVFDGAPPVTQNSRELVVADFNGDLRPDVFIADTGQDQDPMVGFQNTLILSAPGGKLIDATANLPQASDFTHSAAAGDVNGDGSLDLYIGNLPAGVGAGPPRILLNDGSGHFAASSAPLPFPLLNFTVSSYTSSLFLDVAGNSKADLILGGELGESLVLVNDGTGQFTILPGALPPKAFGPGGKVLDIASQDLNRDGRSDLLMASTKSDPYYLGRWIQLLIANGDGTFRDETATRLPQSDNNDPWPISFQPRDLSRDGITDYGLLVNGGAAPAYLVDSEGRFQPGPNLNANDEYWAFVDAYGEGANDVLAVDRGIGRVTLLRERPVLAGPSPDARPPAPGPLDATPPVLSLLRVNPSTLRVRGARGTRTRVRTSTMISYTSSEPVTAIFTFQRAVFGVRRGRRCARLPRKPGRAKRCIRRFVATRGLLSHLSKAGPNRLRFTGRFDGITLRPGTYRLTAVGKDIGGNLSAPQRVRLRVVSGR